MTWTVRCKGCNKPLGDAGRKFCSRECYYKNKKGYIKIHPNLIASGTLAYVLGALKGDGAIFIRGDGNGVVQLKVTDETFARCVLKGLQKIKLKPHLRQGKLYDLERKTPYIVTAYSLEFARWYLTLTCDALSNMVKDYPIAFVKGFYEAEGCCCDAHRLRIYNTDLNLLILVKGLLQSLSIEARLYPRILPSSSYLQIHKNESYANFLSTIQPCIKIGEPR